MNAAAGETSVQSTPAIALAARLPKLCTAASRPKAEPRSASGARRGHGRVLGRLHAADPHAGQHEADQDKRDARPGGREHDVGRAEAAPCRRPGRAPSPVGRPGGRPGCWPAWRPGCSRRRGTRAIGVAESEPWPGVRSSPARRIRSVAAMLPNSKAPTATISAPRRPWSTGRTRNRMGSRSRAVEPRQVADGVDDGQRGQEPGDDREQDGRTHADGGHQGQGQQRAADGPQVVHGPLEAVGPPVDVGRDGVGQEGVAGRDPQATGRPGSRPQHAHLPGGAGQADEPREHGRGRIAADRGGPPALGVVGQRSAAQARRAGQAVGDPLDHAQGGGGRAQRAREQAGEQRRRDLVPEVREQARPADAADRGTEPLLRRGPAGRGSAPAAASGGTDCSIPRRLREPRRGVP